MRPAANAAGRIRSILAALELTAGVLALVLEHLDPALPLTSVLALAVVLRALASTLAGATVDAEAASRNRIGIGSRNQRCARDNEGRGSHGDLRAGLFIELHFPLLCMSSRHSWRRAANRAIALNSAKLPSLLFKAP